MSLRTKRLFAALMWLPAATQSGQPQYLRLAVRYARTVLCIVHSTKGASRETRTTGNASLAGDTKAGGASGEEASWCNCCFAPSGTCVSD